MKSHSILLQDIYKKLYGTFGPQHWWPGVTQFEIIIGAILTQNTNWQNVEKAIINLKQHRNLTPSGLKKIHINKLAKLIRPAGYYNLKAKRLKEFSNFLFNEYKGNLKRMFQTKYPLLRRKLLNVKGIGPETADSILLYAGFKPIFVVDAYTKRVLSRHNILNHNADYNEIQQFFMQNLPNRTKLFNEYHALLVRVGKHYCRKVPKCNECPLKSIN